MASSQCITTIGLAKIAAALAGGPPVSITEMAVGDADTAPAPALTALGNEQWRGAVNSVDPDPADASRVFIEAEVPVAVGGWTAKEAGAFDAAGDLILIARIPDAYKPDPAVDGAGLVLYICLIAKIANAVDAFALSVDSTIIMATRAYVDDSIGAVLHPLYC